MTNGNADLFTGPGLEEAPESCGFPGGAHAARPAPQSTRARAPASNGRATPSLSAIRPHRLSVCVLGSGSGGNCTVIRLGDHAILIDCGFGPATTARRLQAAEFDLANVRAVCLTHLDHDHFRPHWIATLAGWSIRVFVHRWYLERFLELPKVELLAERDLITPFNGEGFEPLPGLRTTPISLAHDTRGSSGFHLECEHGRIGYATDLGHVPDALVERFAGVDLLAIESNYDPQMQLNSSRPYFLKKRIMDGAGHLSNHQAFDAVQRIVDRSPHGRPGRIVLLHRSQQCNEPAIVRQVFGRDRRIATRVTLAEQRRRTPWFPIMPAATMAREQLRLWG